MATLTDSHKLAIDLSLLTSTQTFAYKSGATVEESRQFTTFFQINAFKIGTTVTEALQFTTSAQLNALRAKATVTEALQDDGYPFLARFYGVNEADSANFINEYQIAALIDAAIIALAGSELVTIVTQFSNEYQLKAYKLGATIANAVQVINEYQWQALESGATIEQSLLIDSEITLYNLLVSNSVTEENAFITLMQSKFTECTTTSKEINTDIEGHLMKSLFKMQDQDLALMKEHVTQTFNVIGDTGECYDIFIDAMNNYTPA